MSDLTLIIEKLREFDNILKIGSDKINISTNEKEVAKSFENIPAMPDAFDDDYEQKMQERDNALRNKAQYDAQQNIVQQQQQQYQQQQLMEQQARLQDAANKYAKGEFPIKEGLSFIFMGVREALGDKYPCN